jgi:predicted alpha/beta superfamily hydrolase
LAQHPNVRIDHSEIRKSTSDILKQNFRLYVQLPVNYAKTKKRYPVLYILDGHWLFPMVTGINSCELGDGAIPEMILVGITWGGVNPNYESFREIDYTPTCVTGAPNSGNASKFLTSIKKEIIPFIDSNYRVEKKDRTLMAGSFGGLFAAYIIFEDVGLFSRYIIASPSLDWDNSIILNYEQHYWGKSSTLNVRIAISG